MDNSKFTEFTKNASEKVSETASDLTEFTKKASKKASEVEIPKEISIPTDGVAFLGVGAAAGAGVSATVGGIGLAAMGTAVGVSMAPLAAVGAGIGALSYGAYRLGKRVSKNSNTPEIEESEKPSDK